MKYMHIRPGNGETEHRDKVGAVTVAYEFNEGTALIGLSMCSPKDQFWRKKGNSIASIRLKTNPIILEQTEDSWDEEELYSVVKALFLDPPEWGIAEQLPFQPSFQTRVEADVIGPNGRLVHASLDVRGKQDGDEVVLRSWAVRLPAWTKAWAEGLA